MSICKVHASKQVIALCEFFNSPARDFTSSLMFLREFGVVETHDEPKYVKIIQSIDFGYKIYADICVRL